MGARTLAAWVLLVALALRALIPAGWMPNTAGLGRAPLVICTAAGARVVDPGRTGPRPIPHNADRHDVCAFAGLGAAPPAAPPILAPPVAHAQTGGGSLPATRFAYDSRGHREQAARAPPTEL